MKRFFNKYISSLLLCGGVLFTSCDKFLDIQPAGQLEQDKMFGDIQGFRDAMYGAYSSMAQTNLYGEALSYGFLDNLGQMFGYDNAANLSYYSTQYDYKRKEVKDVIDNIWASQYQTISYVNNIIAHINSTSIKSKELDYMKGECLGLRAFLHFDVARLFAEDYTRSTRRLVEYLILPPSTLTIRSCLHCIRLTKRYWQTSMRLRLCLQTTLL